MKVRDQSVNCLEFISRIDKNLCPAASGLYNPILTSCRLQCTAACSTYRNHSSAVFLCVIDQFRLIFIHNIKLRVHMMLFNIIYFYRTESSKTYM